MKFIQTFWCSNNPDILQRKFGWMAAEYNLMSWSLSCLQLKHFYNDVILYTNSTACKLLIDCMQLPYTDIKVCLDKFNTYHPDLWTLPKIYTYSQQNEPFLHVDGDVFIWKEFEAELLNKNLITQNLEAATNYYGMKLQELEKHLIYFPKEIQEDRNENNPIYAYNAGILGGSDIDFFQSYTKKAFQFVNANINQLSKINVTDFNIFFEQYLFYCMVKQQNKEVAVLIEDVIADNGYKGFGDFTEVPHNKKYLHLLGTYKKNKQICQQLANRLRQDYPEYYYKIISLYKSNNLPLFKDYYYFLNHSEEQDLIERYTILKIGEKDNSVSVPAKDSLQSLEETEDIEKAITAILQNKFCSIPKDFLYARDIKCTSVFQYIFKTEKNIYEKIIVADNIIEVIKVKPMSNADIYAKRIKIILEEDLILDKNENIYWAVIPECHKKGFTLLNIDELDVLILDILQQPFSILELFNALKPSFDEDDLKNSEAEFEELIFGRIKRALEFKMIKCLMN